MSCNHPTYRNVRSFDLFECADCGELYDRTSEDCEVECTAVLVTRGDVDLSNIIDGLAGFFAGVVVWNNAQETQDLKTYGQYVAALARCTTRWVYFQDDDCRVSDPVAIWNERAPGRIVCNMSKAHQANYVGFPDKLLGFGSVFERELIVPTFARYFRVFRDIDFLYREAMRIFSGLNTCDVVDVPVFNLPWADAPNRLYKQPDHIPARDEARMRVRTVLDREIRGGRR